MGTARTRAWPALALPVVITGLTLFGFLQYGDTLRLPLVGDDWFFIDKTRHLSWATVWAPRDLVPAYYRPWSRELHYGVLQRIAGASGTPFRIANLGLWLGVMALYFALVRRLAGTRVAGVAAAATAALAGWGVLLVWPAGAQDLWMLLFALLFLHGFARRRALPALAALALALLSKESAAVLPAIAFAHAWTVDGSSPGAALRRVAPGLALVAAWAMFHPLIGGRLWGAPQGVPPFAEHVSAAAAALRTLLASFDLDALPAPDDDWSMVVVRGILGAVLLAGLAALALRPGPAPAGAERRGAASARAERATASADAARPRAPRPAIAPVLRFGAAWAVIAWLPLARPGLGWHAYYTLLGSLGAWLAIAALLASRPRLALATVALLPMLRAARGATFADDWGTEWYQRRAGRLVAVMKRDLLERHPSFPPGSRVFLADLPGGVSLVAGPGNSPALKAWYHDPALWVAFLSQYRARGPHDPPGRDYFFVGRENGSWNELVVGPEDVAARQVIPHWSDYHQNLADVLYRGGDVRGALAESEKLAEAMPERFEFALNAGVCARALGDTAAASRWFARAAAAQRSVSGSKANE